MKAKRSFKQAFEKFNEYLTTINVIDSDDYYGYVEVEGDIEMVRNDLNQIEGIEDVVDSVCCNTTFPQCFFINLTEKALNFISEVY